MSEIRDEKVHHPVYVVTGPGPDYVTGLNMNALDDWHDVTRVFREEFDGRRVTGVSIPGRNFLTEEVLGMVETPNGPAEVSTSYRGLLTDHRVFGVTFARFRGEDGDPSCYCEEWGDVVDVCNRESIR